MNKIVQIEDIVPIIEEQLKSGGKVSFTPRGTSMLPLFRGNVDTVILATPEFTLKKYNIVFYRRNNGQYILHRIVKVQKDSYKIRGDNQVVNEYGISKDNIIAVVVGFKRNGKEYTTANILYKIYSIIWVKTVLLRKCYRKGRRILSGIKRKTLRKDD